MSTCGFCGGLEIGAHHHEPDCPRCGVDLMDLMEDATDATPAYCIHCGLEDPWRLASEIRRGERAAMFDAGYAPS